MLSELLANWRRKRALKQERVYVLANQLAEGRVMWARLRASDVVPDETQVRLSFSYRAPGRGQAANLAQFLREETDYEVQAGEDSVTGTTQAMTLNDDNLPGWTIWMVDTGYENGGCQFVGWGAASPTAG